MRELGPTYKDNSLVAYSIQRQHALQEVSKMPPKITLKKCENRS
jgi:hypothetical protein